MEVLLAISGTILFCALCLFMYLTHRNNTRILELNENVRILQEENRKLREGKSIGGYLPSKHSLQENEIENLQEENHELHEENLLNNVIRRLHENISEKDKEIKRITSLANEYVNEIQKLNKKLYEKEIEIETLNIKRERLKQLLREKDKEIEKLKKELEGKKQPTGRKFVSVKFYRNSPDKFDYFIGKITGLKIGDYVMVPVKGTLKPATVCYISKPGEISQYARSEIVSKIDKREQMSLFD
ncbi:MAG: hypothetical protein IJK81_05455 [Selenomonadaceae bacterium]|nr:hypothetical protein [Selenomonadaceae bacterium]